MNRFGVDLSATLDHSNEVLLNFGPDPVGSVGDLFEAWGQGPAETRVVETNHVRSSRIKCFSGVRLRLSWRDKR